VDSDEGLSPHNPAAAHSTGGLAEHTDPDSALCTQETVVVVVECVRGHSPGLASESMVELGVEMVVALNSLPLALASSCLSFVMSSLGSGYWAKGQRVTDDRAGSQALVLTEFVMMVVPRRSLVLPAQPPQHTEHTVPSSLDIRLGSESSCWMTGLVLAQSECNLVVDYQSSASYLPDSSPAFVRSWIVAAVVMVGLQSCRILTLPNYPTFHYPNHLQTNRNFP